MFKSILVALLATLFMSSTNPILTNTYTYCEVNSCICIEVTCTRDLSYMEGQELIQDAIISGEEATAFLSEDSRVLLVTRVPNDSEL
jgi:hypothetical protein